MSVIGSNCGGTVVTIIRRRNSLLSQEGEPIEVWMADLLDLNVEAIFEPLRYQVTMTEGFTKVAVGRRFPTEHDRIVAKGDQSIEDFGRVKLVEDFAVQLDVPSGAYRAKPVAGL